jgi:hypothetical protein
VSGPIRVLAVGSIHKFHRFFSFVPITRFKRVRRVGSAGADNGEKLAVVSSVQFEALLRTFVTVIRQAVAGPLAAVHIRRRSDI